MASIDLSNRYVAGINGKNYISISNRLTTYVSPKNNGEFSNKDFVK
jgi:hypothetical protein